MSFLSSDPDWFVVDQAGPGVFVIQEPGHVNSFLVCGRERAALIDTGMGFSSIQAAVARITPLPVTVLNTHWHFDHIGGNREFASWAISEKEAGLAVTPLSNALLRALYLDPCMAMGAAFPRGFAPDRYEIVVPKPDRLLREGDRVELGGRCLEVVETPGHTRGSLCFLDGAAGALFCGDLLYEGTLYAHFTDSDPAAYTVSLDRLQGMMPKISRIYTAHNTPVLAPEIISRARALLHRAAGTLASPTVIRDWGLPVLRHSAGGLDLLTPVPGSCGVDLLAPGPALRGSTV